MLSTVDSRSLADYESPRGAKRAPAGIFKEAYLSWDFSP